MDRCNQKEAIGRRIKEARNALGMRQKDFSARIGMPMPSFRDYELGNRIPGGEAITAFMSAGISADWLLTGKGEMLLDTQTNPKLSEFDPTDMQPEDRDDFSLVSLYNVEASAGHGAVVDREETICQIAFRKDWIKTKGLQKEKLVAIKAKGDSMYPTLYDGDLLLVDTSVEKIMDDSIYIIQDNHSLIVKRVQRTLGGALTIISDNPIYERQHLTPEQAASLKIVGRVCWYGHEI